MARTLVGYPEGGGPSRRSDQTIYSYRTSLARRIAEYLREVRNELAKVAWPGRAEVIKYTTVVFCTVVLLTAVVFGLDATFAKLVLQLFPH